MTESSTEERVAKRIARSGLCSRREAERLVLDRRVEVDGVTIDSPALDVAAGQVVTVDGEPLPAAEPPRLFRFHKPKGVLTTERDPGGRATIYDRLPPGLPRLMPVGRLDYNSDGRLLLTNDGGLKRKLELPATGWLRRYRVRAHGRIDQPALDRLKAGIEVEGVRYGPIEARLERTQGANNWLTMGLREGRNREVRRVLNHLGLDVNRLIRVSFGPFQLGGLAEGGVEEVTGKVLREQLGRLVAFEAPRAARVRRRGASPNAKGTS